MSWFRKRTIFPVTGKGVLKQVKKGFESAYQLFVNLKFLFGAEAWGKREITSNFSGE